MWIKVPVGSRILNSKWLEIEVERVVERKIDKQKMVVLLITHGFLHDFIMKIWEKFYEKSYIFNPCFACIKNKDPLTIYSNKTVLTNMYMLLLLKKGQLRFLPTLY